MLGELKVVNIQKHTASAFLVVTNYNMSVGSTNKNYALARLDFKKPFFAHFNHVILVPGKPLIHI